MENIDKDKSVCLKISKTHKKYYSKPICTVYGEVEKITRSLGNAPPTDSETQVSGHVSP